VESLFQKISSLPENVRQAAINKIHERLAPNSCYNARIASTTLPQSSLEVTLTGNASTVEYLNPSVALATIFNNSNYPGKYHYVYTGTLYRSVLLDILYF
jgi:hypothetical protein